MSREREENSLDRCAKGKGSAGVVTEATCCGFWVVGFLEWGVLGFLFFFFKVLNWFVDRVS